MSDIRVDMDISDAINKSAKLAAILAKTGVDLKNLINTTINLNETGKANAATVEGQINANQKLTLSLTNVDGAWQIQTRAIKASNEAIKRQRDELQAVLSLNARNRVESLAKKGSIGYDASELARIEKIKTAIGKLDTEVVTAKKVADFFKEIKAGNIPEATGALARLRDELVKLANIQGSAQARIAASGAAGTSGLTEAELKRRAALRAQNFQQSYSNFVVNPLANDFKLNLGNISLSDEAQIRKIGANIARIMRKSFSEDANKIVDNVSVRKLIPDLIKGNQLNFINRPELQAASQEISKLIGLFERLRKTQDLASAVSPAAQNRINKAATSAANEGRAISFLGSGLDSSFKSALQTQFKIKASDLTRGQEEQIKQVYASLANVIRKSSTGLDSAKIDSLFTSIRTGTAGIANTAELEKVYDRINRIIGVYERLRQVQDRKARTDQGNTDQTLLSEAAAKRNERQTQITQERLRRAFQPLNADLRITDAGLDLDKNNKVQGLLRQIAELGTKSQLTSREVVNLFEKFNSNNLGPAEQKFRRLFDFFAKLNAETTRVRQAALDQNPNLVSPSIRSGGGSPVLPNTALGGLPPGGRDIEKAKEYSTIWDKLKNSFDYFLIYRGINVLTDQLTRSISASQQLQISISLVRTISQDAQQSFFSWQRDLIGVSNATGLAIEDVAKAGYDAVSNQVARGRNVAAFLREAGDLARTTNSTLQDSVNLLSSGLNAYGLDVSNAERLSAQFFRTIDLGRVKAADLANTFGRVAFVGRDLGATQEELLAVISTLTRNGVTADDAITLLTNGMSKLTKPTEKMKELLDQWGFSGSGRIAVQTEGFLNIFNRMIEAVKSGKVEITDLFNEIRGEKFASAFKNFGSQIGSDVSQIRNSGAAYGEARVIRGESDADKIAKQVNEFKNTLSTTFGSEVTNLIAKTIELSGGVDTLVKSLTVAGKTLVVLGTGFTAYKAATLVAGLATSALNAVIAAGVGVKTAYSAATTRQTVAQVANTTATAANSTATAVNSAAVRANAAAYYAHPIGAFIAIAASVYAYWQTSTYQIGVQNEALRDLDASYAALQRRQTERRQTSNFQNVESEIEDVASGVRNVSRALAAALQGANNALEVAKNNSQRTSEALKDGFSSYTELTRKKIADIAADYEKLDSRIKNSNRTILSFREAARSQLFNTNMQYSGGFEFDGFRQREQLIQAERTRLRASIQKLYAEGTDESVAAARQEGQELLRIDKQLFDLRVERQKKGIEQTNRQYGIRGTTFFGVDPRQLQREQDQTVDFLEGLEKRYQSGATRAGGQSLAQQTILRARLGVADSAKNELASFRVFNNSGGVVPEFQDRLTGQVDVNKVKESLARLKTRITNNLDPQVLREAGPEIQRLIDERFRAIETEIQATEAQQRLSKAQQQSIEGVRGLSVSMQNARTDIQRYGGDITNVVTQLTTMAETLRGLGAIGGGLQDKLVDRFIDRDGAGEGGAAARLALRARESALNAAGAAREAVGGGPRERGPLTNEAILKIERYQALALEAKNQLADLPNRLGQNGLLDPVAAQRAIETLQRVITSGKQLAAEATRGQGDQERQSLESQLRIPETERLLAEAKRELGTATQRYNQSVLGLEALRIRASELSGSVATTVTDLGRLGPAAGNAATGFQSIAGAAKAADASVADMLRRLSGLNYRGPQGGASGASPIGPAAQMSGGNIYGYAAGGGVGSDNQAIYAQAGEFVWNRSASRRFYSQIATGNNIGRTPIEFTSNEGDTINVGGINVNEAADGQLSGNALMGMLKRMKRRS